LRICHPHPTGVWDIRNCWRFALVLPFVAKLSAGGVAGAPGWGFTRKWQM